MPTSTHNSHRRQEERSAETRTKLLEATIDSILDVGYAATTTRRVAQIAGVSQGAQTHHYPYKVDLVGAAVEHLAERRLAEIRTLAGELPEEPEERIETLLDLIWADFSSTLFTVFVKLYVAAADDPELHARLVPIERRLTAVIAELSHELLGELAETPDFSRLLLTVLSAARGLALTERFEPRGRPRSDPWPLVRTTLLEVLRAHRPAGP